MPRPNSSRPSGNRRGQSRSNATGKPYGKSGKKDSENSFGDKRGPRKTGTGKPFRKTSGESSFGKKDDAPFRKSSSSSSRTGKPFRKTSGESSFGKKDDAPFRRSSSSSSRTGTGKPFRKTSGESSFGKSDDAPFRKSSSSSRTRTGGKSFDKPSSSRPERGEKSFGRSSDKGGFGRKDKSSFDKPSSSRGERSSKPFRSSEKTGFGRKDKPSFDKSGSSRPERGGKSFRPTSDKRDFDKKDKPPFRKTDSDEGKGSFARKRTASFGLPYKRVSDKSDRKKEGKEGEAPFKSRAGYGEKPAFTRTKRAREVRNAPAPVGAEGIADGTRQIRLNKYISNSGVCSRREADELITMGLISVNGKTITELGYKVNPGDEVRHENKLLTAEKPVYILMNKPKGFLTTTSDPQERNTVMHLIGNAVKERIYPVGRLDRNTTGLLLLTNDGELAEKLMHPSHNMKKIYKIELDRPLTKGDFDKIAEGVQLEEGRATVDDIAIISEDKKTVGVEIHIGWNRVVRRIFESLEYQVLKLDRSVYAGLDKKDLQRGHWRYLSKEELVRLKHYK